MTRVLRVLLALGVAAAAGAAVWRRWGFEVRAVERDVPRVPDPPAPAPEAPGRADVQTEADGVGPAFHRRYSVDVADAHLDAKALMARIAADIQAFVPAELATFTKTVGAEGTLAVGDEFDIKIRSPWNGPVRVAEVTPAGFVLATLDGHMEAGQIRFGARDTGPQALRFEIESWARSATPAVDAVYDDLGVAKAAQQAMWTFFCERVAEATGGEPVGEIRVRTEREAPAAERDRRS